MEACAEETLYEYTKVDVNGGNGNFFTPGRCMSGSKSRKRKRLKENIAKYRRLLNGGDRVGRLVFVNVLMCF
jgi:hypothetical protein